MTKRRSLNEILKTAEEVFGNATIDEDGAFFKGVLFDIEVTFQDGGKFKSAKVIGRHGRTKAIKSLTALWRAVTMS